MRTDLQRLKRDTESGRSSLQAVQADSIEESQIAPSKTTSGSQSTSTAEPERPKKWWIRAVPAAIAVVGFAILALRFAFPLPPLRVSGIVQLTNDGTAKFFPGFFDSLATDGSRLYYVESPFVSPVLMQVSTLGGETSAIPTPFLVNQIGDISRDRSSLLVPAYEGLQYEAPLWLLPLPAGTPHRLGELLAMTEPGFQMDREYSLPRTTTCTSPPLVERKPKNSPLSQASRFGPAGRQTVHVCAYHCLT